MNPFLMASAQADDEGLFGSYMLTNAIFACFGFLVASIILSLAVFLSSPNTWMLPCIWAASGGVVIRSWILIRIANRKAVFKWVVVGMTVFMWAVWAFEAYATFYCGLWSMIHPHDRFTVDPHWKNVLFLLGGLLALGAMKHLNEIHIAIRERMRLFAVGRSPTPKPNPAKINAQPGNTLSSAKLKIGSGDLCERPDQSFAKVAALTELRERVLACVKCPNLAATRKNVVFGAGNINAQLMFIAEAPGVDEDAQGEPFVSRTGQLLTNIIEATGLKRSDVYIAYAVKCRPDPKPGQTSINRSPTLEECAACMPYLSEQINLIKPKVIVALGSTGLEALLGKPASIMKMRGNWQEYRGIPLMPTFHPAYLMRNQAASEKRKVWEDLLKVMEKLEMPISEKMRGFFLESSQCMKKTYVN